MEFSVIVMLPDVELMNYEDFSGNDPAFSLTPAASASDVLTACELGQPDLVVAMETVPEFIVTDMAAAVREVAGFSRHVPILAVQGKNIPERIATFRATGINGLIPGSFNKELLVKLLRWWYPLEFQKEDEIRETLRNIDDAKTMDDRIIEDLKTLDPDSEGLLEQLLASFTNDVEKNMCDLQQALLDESPDDVDRFAHAIRGSTSNLGAKRMAEICTTMMDESREGSLSGLDALYPELRAEFDRTRIYLAHRLIAR